VLSRILNTQPRLVGLNFNPTYLQRRITLKEEYPMLVDSHCSEIMLVLSAKGKMRFNELFRTLTKGLNVKISKPSLVEHLNKHLAKKKLIIRKREGKQNVTYEYNEEILKIPEISKEKLRELFDDMQKETSHTKIRRINLPIENDVDVTLYDFIQTFLEDLQRRIVFRSILKLKLEDPKEYLEFLVFGNPFFQARENEIVDKSLKDEKYQGELFSRIEELIEEMKKRRKDSRNLPI